MGMNAIFFAWNRSIPGRENLSAEHFDDYVKYLEGLKQKGTITTYDVVFLANHGGDMNGFFFIQGDPGKLDGLVASENWQTHMVRANMHLEGSGAVRGFTGQAALQQKKLWNSLIPE
jgi:hypothetical protein